MRLKYAQLLRKCGHGHSVHVSHLIGQNDRAVCKRHVCYGDAFARRKVPCARALGWPDTECEP